MGGRRGSTSAMRARSAASSTVTATSVPGKCRPCAVASLRAMQAVRIETPPQPERLSLTSVELRNLLEISWRDGHRRPESYDDEWPQNMRSDVDQLVAELDKWKVLGVPKEAFPDWEPTA